MAVSEDMCLCKMCSACIVWDLTCCCLCPNHIPRSYTNLGMILRQQLGSQLCPHRTMLQPQNKNLFSAMHAVSPSCQFTETYASKIFSMQNMIPSIKTCLTLLQY